MGTIKTLLNKLLYGIKARGIDGTTRRFEARARCTTVQGTHPPPARPPLAHPGRAAETGAS